MKCPNCNSEYESGLIIGDPFLLTKHKSIVNYDQMGMHIHNPNKRAAWVLCPKGHRFVYAYPANAECPVMGCSGSDIRVTKEHIEDKTSTVKRLLRDKMGKWVKSQQSLQ